MGLITFPVRIAALRQRLPPPSAAAAGPFSTAAAALRRGCRRRAAAAALRQRLLPPSAAAAALPTAAVDCRNVSPASWQRVDSTPGNHVLEDCCCCCCRLPLKCARFGGPRQREARRFLVGFRGRWLRLGSRRFWCRVRGRRLRRGRFWSRFWCRDRGRRLHVEPGHRGAVSWGP